jgi:hypothetical protein
MSNRQWRTRIRARITEGVEEVNEVKATPSVSTRHRGTWRWALTLLLGIAGIAGAVMRHRRDRSRLEQFVVPPPDQLTWRFREAATERSPIGNGVVRTHRPPAGEG